MTEEDNLIPFYRVVVFVPQESFEEFRVAIQDKIPKLFDTSGAADGYDRVLWWSNTPQQPSQLCQELILDGIEQFRPLDNAHPAQGQIGETLQTPSMQLEFSFPDDETALRDFIKNILHPAHPWEQPVIYAHRAFLVKI